MFVSAYIAISILIGLFELLLALSALSHETNTARLFALTAACSAFVSLSYMVSVLVPGYFATSVASSFYFAGIDVMLMAFLTFMIHFTESKPSKKFNFAYRILLAWMVLEIIVFAINPFYEIAVSFVPFSGSATVYIFQPKLPFMLHLGYTYTIVACVTAQIIYKCMRVPREYRITFISVLVSFGVIVAINALYLVLPENDHISGIDWSTLGYVVCIGAIYWSQFVYRKHGLLNRLKNEVFEGVDQGVAMFDYADYLILSNAHTQEMFPGINLNDELHISEFTKSCGIDEKMLTAGSYVSLQIYGYTIDGSTRPLRCDFRTLMNDKGDAVGKLFVFADMTNSTDLLTGFQSFESFKTMIKARGVDHPKDMTVIICDPNALSATNQLYGHTRGDQSIRQLAKLMKKHLPSGSYFVRGRDANLMAFCYSQSSSMIMSTMAKIRSEYVDSFQFAFADFDKYDENTDEAISAAEHSLQTKKLLDKGSARSSMLTSLIQALQESDAGTEAHVKRTQILGEHLSERIGLSDVERSNLALLCLLHDIGKIGIPLEILNKPGKLTDEEWVVLKSHTEKGYQIAMSSKELRDIAEMIKYHHEQWDGKGYPEGLSRESIPLLSRVIAVVDAYDAMISTRAYRKGMSPEMAIEELRSHAGTQFDPFIVSAFIQMMNEEGPELNQLMDENRSEDPLRMQGGDYLFAKPTATLPTTIHVHNMNYTRYILDKSNRIISTDANFEHITGYSAEDLAERPLYQFELIPADDRTEYLVLVQESTAKSDLAYFEHRLLRKNGTIAYVFCMGRMYFDSAAREERTEIVVTSLADTFAMKELTDSQEAKAQARLAQWEKTYRRDSLTGLLTHSAFRSDVEDILLKGERKVLYLMMDLDNFKVYNDTFGHQEGDQFLIFVAQSITAALRPEDMASRVGGDEFAAVILFDANVSDDDIMTRARQFFDAISVSLRSAENGCSVSMGAAISLSQTTDTHDTFNALYARADQALYDSKSSGRDKLTM